MNFDLDAIIWWEKRRILFNVVVLVAGSITVALIEVIGSRFVKPGEDVEEPLGLIIGVVAYALAANVCYTLGWITELLWGSEDVVGLEVKRQKIFRLGMAFSVILTLSPAVLLPLLWSILGVS